MCVRETEINSFEITVIIFNAYKNVNLLFKTDLKSAELLTKTFFFLYFRGVRKIRKELN